MLRNTVPLVELHFRDGTVLELGEFLFKLFALAISFVLSCECLGSCFFRLFSQLL
jgi:hypothetical protein